MLKEGKELAVVIDEISGMTDVRSNLGAMGVITNGNLTVILLAHSISSCGTTALTLSSQKSMAEDGGLLTWSVVRVCSLHLSAEVLALIVQEWNFSKEKDTLMDR